VTRAGKLANLIVLELALACILNAAGAATAARFGHFGGGAPRYSVPSHGASFPRFPSFPRYGSAGPRPDARYGSAGPRPDARYGSAPRQDARDGGWRDRGWADRRARDSREQARADAGRWHDYRDRARPDAGRWGAAQQSAPVAGPGAMVMAPGAMLGSPASSAASSLIGLAAGLVEDLVSSYMGARSYDEMSAQETMDNYSDDYYGDTPDTGGPVMSQDYRY